MKAIVIDAYGEADKFQERELPIPEAKDYQVRIRLKASGFNPVDFKIRKGTYGGATFPLVIGSDCSGVIDQVGKKVKDFKVNDEVYAFVFGQGSNGTYAEYVCIDGSFVCKKPQNISFEEAATVPLSALTALTALRAVESVKKKKAVFIAGGSGGVGSFAIQIAHSLGAEVYTTAGSQESAHYLSEHLQVKEENIFIYTDPSKKPKKLFPVVIDLVGKEMTKLCFELADLQGDFVTLMHEYSDSSGFQKSLHIHPVFVGTESYLGGRKTWKIYRKELAKLYELIEKGDVKIPKFEIVGNLSASSVQRAHQLLEASHVKGKLVMIHEKPS